MRSEEAVWRMGQTGSSGDSKECQCATLGDKIAKQYTTIVTRSFDLLNCLNNRQEQKQQKIRKWMKNGSGKGGK